MVHRCYEGEEEYLFRSYIVEWIEEVVTVIEEEVVMIEVELWILDKVIDQELR